MTIVSFVTKTESISLKKELFNNYILFFNFILPASFSRKWNLVEELPYMEKLILEDDDDDDDIVT